MATYPLNEPFEISGEWFLPENPERIIPGTLRYKSGQSELHLNGAFRSFRKSFGSIDSVPPYPSVYGTTVKGDAMTLLEVHHSGTSLSSGSGGTRESERLLSTFLLVGGHIPTDFEYPEMRFRIPGIQIWNGKDIIKRSFTVDNITNDFSLTYQVGPPEKDQTPVSSVDAVLGWGIGFKEEEFFNFTGISLEVSGWVTITPSSPKSAEWFFDQHHKISTMLAFFAGTPMPPDQIDVPENDYFNKASILLSMREGNYCAYKNAQEFFMPRNAMGIDFSRVVDRWFDVFPQIDQPSRLALSVLSSEKLWLHTEFLSLMQALEGFHRGLFEGNYTDEESFAPVKNALEAAIPHKLEKDHKESLLSRIRYGNQISLRRRLDELTKILSVPLRKLIFGQREKVPRNWVDTRNYYTHWDEDLRSNILDSSDMYYANIRMRHFLRALYLDLMGVPHDAIVEALGNSSDESQYLVQLNLREQQSNNSGESTGEASAVQA